MARRFFPVALGAALIYLGFFISLGHGQTPSPQPAASPSASASPSPSDENNPEKRERPFRKEFLSPEQQKKYDSLPPEQQQRMQENWERWQKMSPEERKQMRDNEKLRRQMMAQEIETAIQQSGLNLDDQTRDEYVMRYTEERRKIEQKLQVEMEEKRRPLVQALIERLKLEFQAKASSPAASSPSPSPAAAASSPTK